MFIKTYYIQNPGKKAWNVWSSSSPYQSFNKCNLNSNTTIYFYVSICNNIGHLIYRYIICLHISKFKPCYQKTDKSKLNDSYPTFRHSFTLYFALHYTFIHTKGTLANHEGSCVSMNSILILRGLFKNIATFTRLLRKNG